MGIVRPVMAEYPYAWIFFIIFIVCTTFTVLNLFIGIIVSAMTADGDAKAEDSRDEIHRNQNLILQELRELRAEIRQNSSDPER